MIRAQITKGLKLPSQFKTFASNLNASMEKAMTIAAFKLESRVKQKLDNNVLKRRSSALFNSIHHTVTPRGDGIWQATVGSRQGIPYAAIHEYGGVIPAHIVEVRYAKALSFFWKGKQRFFKRVSIPPVTMPERSYLRSSLTEMTPEIRDILIQAELDALQRALLK